ncbi:hypothetical protein SADUNF_Sadunf17G0093300 [Salix dunnii]|uniref:Integrase catalytic domain-containing protein n=1 Tax=Salix dunnii TaxID=1413687 RepID=A0A835JAM5_9ROSI|nr:hypothetical protein SADUNF_Sadunf17G0093300 [Salix dunnii]
MVSEPTMDSSTSSVSSTSSAPEPSLAKTQLPDISIKLASNNYLLWKAQVTPILRGHGLLGYVTNEITCPDASVADANGILQPNPAAATWLRTDQLILGWINSSLSDGPLSQVINSESCHDAWMVLETLYGSHTRDRIQHMKGELQTLCKGSCSLEDYLHKAKSLALSLRGAGKPMDEDDLIVCILRGLGSEFDPIVAALNARDMFPSLESVISKLRDFELRIQNTKTTSSNVAFYSNRNRSQQKPQGYTIRERERSGGYFKGKFQGRGREAYNTRLGENYSRSKLPPPTRTTRNYGRGRGGITCFRCGGPNHKADGCFASEDDAAQYKAFAAIQITENADDSWYPDTGANQHMTSNPSEVKGIDSYSGNDTVMVGNGNGLTIVGKGHTTLSTTALKLNNVLIVPEIKKKLLSVSQFTRDNNCYFLFYPWGFLLKDMKTRKVLLKGLMADGLYPINLRQLQHHAFSFLANKVPGSLWHARLGHPHPQIIGRLALPSLHGKIGFCESCMLGKSTKLPFTSRQTYATEFLHTLHTDVWGPASVTSFDGFRFYLIIIDEYSRYVWLFPMARKSEVATIFPMFIKRMENQFSTTVKIIQSDGGGEFVNIVLQSYFAAHGIIHQRSCPGTPEQNGLAERRHRYVVETGLTLMAHASVPTKYWTTAFQTAMFLINYLPSSALQHKSPHEMVFGSSPSLEFLRVFGCACYPLLSPFGRSKLQYKSVCCAFLGYSAHHKGYYCLEQNSGRIYISRHVRFNELHFPFKTAAFSSHANSLFQLRSLPRNLVQSVLPQLSPSMHHVVATTTDPEATTHPPSVLPVTSTEGSQATTLSILPATTATCPTSMLPPRAHPMTLGFTRCPYDQSLFYKQQGSDVLLLLIYVDDILLTGSSRAQINDLITHLSSGFRMKDLGDVHYFLGLQVTRNTAELTITQTRYLLSLLHKFGLDGAKPVATPLASSTSLSVNEGNFISLPEMDGNLPLYSIADSTLDLEFMMDSEINRILASPGNLPGNPLNGLKPVFNGGPGSSLNSLTATVIISAGSSGS